MARNRIGWIAAFGITAAGGAALSLAARKLFHSTVEADAKWQYGGNRKDAQKPHPLARYKERPGVARAWFEGQEMEEVWITSSVDDTKLHARLLRCEAPKRLVLCAHGYRASASYHFAAVSQWLHENGCSLLLIDQRGCGQSEGRYITYGAREKYDVMDWLDWLDDRNPEGLPLYLYGISLGASTVLCASEYVLPEHLAGIIADCGYSSMRDILQHCLQQWYHIKSHSLLWRMDQLCRDRAHFHMAEADAEKALRKCKVPVLFIHGTADDFVPPHQTIHNYHACASEQKEILWVDGAGHAASYYEDPAAYQEALAEHFRRCEEEA